MIIGMNQSRHGGYIGLIALLISVAIISFMFLDEYVTPRPTANTTAAYQPLTASGTIPTTGIEQMHADLDAAKALQVELDKKNAETQSEIMK